MTFLLIVLSIASLALAALITIAAWPLDPRTNKQSKTREVRRRPF
jgi:hypothetical protein